MQKEGYDIAYDYTDVTEFFNKYTMAVDQESVVNKLRLLFIPHWIFEYHAGLETGSGWLNAVDSKIDINKKYIDKLLVTKHKTLDEIFAQKKYELIDEFVIDPRLTERSEAEKIITYKIPLLANKPGTIITKLQMVYLPFWEISTLYKKEQKTFVVTGLDVNAMQTEVKPYLEERFVPKPDTSESAVFSGALDDFFSPKKFLISFVELLLYIFKPIFTFIGNSFKKHPWISSAVLLVLIILIYLAI